MHIALICQRFFYGGGQERHVYHLARRFVVLGQHVTIVTSEIGASEEFRSRIDLKGIIVRTLPASEMSFPPNQVLFPTLIQELIEGDFDVIHTHGALNQNSTSAALAAHIVKVPLVFTPHFHPWNVFEETNIRRARRMAERLVLAPVMRSAQAVIAVSGFERTMLAKRYQIPKTKIHVIPNGVDISFLQKTDPRRNVRKKYGVPENKRYVLFFGSVTDLRKGIDRAIKIFVSVAQRVPDAHLVILGYRTDNNQTVIDWIHEAGLADRVTAAGYVTDTEKVAFLRMASVLLAPTVYEAFGIVLAESMFMKVPVIATKQGGIPYVVKHGKDGLLVANHHSLQRFAAYTIRLLEDERLRLRMGEAGHKRVQHLFHWTRIARRILTLYRNITKNRQATDLVPALRTKGGNR